MAKDIIFSYVKQTNKQKKKKNRKNKKQKQDTLISVSRKNYFLHFMVRDHFNQVLRMKEVTSQLMVDMYAKIETERLDFIRRNKKN